MNDHSNSSPGKQGYAKRHRYILHLWNGPGTWRASLENLETGKRFGFENLEQLFAYLMDTVENNPQNENAGDERVNDPRAGNTSCGCSSTNSIKTQ